MPAPDHIAEAMAVVLGATAGCWFLDPSETDRTRALTVGRSEEDLCRSIGAGLAPIFRAAGFDMGELFNVGSAAVEETTR